MKLTDPEKKVLKILRKLEERQEAFTYRRVADLAGWKGVQMAWQTIDALEKKGLLARGDRLAWMEYPLVTPAGVDAISRRRAA